MTFFRETPRAFKAKGPVPQVEFIAPVFPDREWSLDDALETINEIFAIVKPKPSMGEVIEINRPPKRKRQRKPVILRGAQEADLAELDSFLEGL